MKNFKTVLWSSLAGAATVIVFFYTWQLGISLNGF